MKRKAISKGTRFRIFTRDEYTCRYCGRQSDVVALHVDHVTPVCQGGTNDDENLITACADCNLGKGGKSPSQAAPTEIDRLRLAQERNEQAAAFRSVKVAIKARSKIRQEILCFWCECRGAESMDKTTLAIMCSYFEQFGPLLFTWIEKACAKFHPGTDDRRVGRYVSGLRKAATSEGGF